MFWKVLNTLVARESSLLTNVSLKSLLARNLTTVAFGQSDLIDKWKSRFEEEKVPEVDASLENILEHVLDKDKDKLANLETKTTVLLTKSQLQRFEELCECRMARMPIQYIIGEWEFRDLVLKMQPPVFIPRPETEELVELVLQQFDCKRTMRFIEVGCGTGAISLALLKALPKATAVAIDQSQQACELAMTNAIASDLVSRLRILRHKLTADSQLDEIEGQVDLIVSNPPYVPRADLKNLEPEISLYEDLRALDGGHDGLDVIRDVLKFAADKLRVKGMLWLEVDPSHPKLIASYLEDKPELNLKYVANYKDMFERERFVEITKV